MLRTRPAGFALATLVFTVGGGLTQETAQLTDVEACRTDPEQVAFSLTYMGGACEATLEAMVEPAGADTLKVSLPTTRTAEICTLQLVPISASGIVAAPPTITQLDVTVLTPDGRPQATGLAEVMSPPHCMLPEIPSGAAEAVPLPTP